MNSIKRKNAQNAQKCLVASEDKHADRLLPENYFGAKSPNDPPRM